MSPTKDEKSQFRPQPKPAGTSGAGAAVDAQVEPSQVVSLAPITVKTWHVLTIAGLWAIAPLAGLVALQAVLRQISAKGESTELPPEISLAIIVVASAVILLTVLGITALMFRWLGLTRADFALGLPNGSIRAVISLMLIVIFACVAVFLVSRAELQGGAAKKIEHVTVEEAALYPAERVVSRTVEAGSDPAAPTFTLEVQPPGPLSTDLSKQLMTTLGTLVVAVASFYFGSNTVTSAQNAIAANLRASRAPDPGAPEGSASGNNSAPESNAETDSPPPDDTGGDARTGGTPETTPGASSTGRQVNIFLGVTHTNRDAP